MSGRLHYLMLLCLTFAIRTSGQTTTYNPGTGHAQPLIPTAQSKLPNTLLGVVIEGWHYDAAQNTLTLHLVNHSNKTATAFNISMAEKYADGSTNPWYAEGIPHNLQDSQKMEDELNLLQSQDERRRGGQDVMRGVFAAGTTRDFVMRGEEKEVHIHGIARVSGPFRAEAWRKDEWRFKHDAVIQEIDLDLPKSVIATALRKQSMRQTIHALEKSDFDRLVKKLKDFGVHIEV